MFVCFFFFAICLSVKGLIFSVLLLKCLVSYCIGISLKTKIIEDSVNLDQRRDLFVFSL